MKINKLIGACFIIGLLFSSCVKDPEFLTGEEEATSLNYVAEIKDGKISLVNQQSLKKEWEQKLKNDVENPNLENFRVVTGELIKGRESFILMAEDNDSNSKTAMALIKKGDRFFINESMGTVTCYGSCTDGCDPQNLGDRWICSNCNLFGDFTCNKKVTIEIE